MNAFERAILHVAPGLAAARARSRVRAMYFSDAYEATRPSRERKFWRERGSGNRAAMMAIRPLREQARQLDRNHDIARSILNILVRNVVGANGIGIEPQPLTKDGDIHDDLATQIHTLHADWSRRPEVTWQYDKARMEQLLCRSWLRDGEVLFQKVTGYLNTLDHGTQVPFSIEMIEADLLPLEFSDVSNGVFQGVQRNAWGKPTGYWLYKSHPNDPAYPYQPEKKFVSADVMGHIKAIDRIGQVRGVSIFASVMTRLDDIKDYEESERIAAKIAASLAAVIKKGDPASFNEADLIGPDGQKYPKRRLEFEPGMIIDDLRPGEDISMLDAKRPNTGLEGFRNGQLRAVAGGVDVSYSAASKNYDGSYSALRQELVDQWSAYGTISNAFIDMHCRPTFEGFITAALLSGQLKIPRDADPQSIRNALYVPPQMPWIDPYKESLANEIVEDRAYESGPEIIRSRGGNPRDVARQQSWWLRYKKSLGIPDVTTGRQLPQVVTPTNPNPNPDAPIPAEEET
ncbi:MAG: phage portal protein [Rudaea sp.]